MVLLFLVFSVAAGQSYLKVAKVYGMVCHKHPQLMELFLGYDSLELI